MRNCKNIASRTNKKDGISYFRYLTTAANFKSLSFDLRVGFSTAQRLVLGPVVYELLIIVEVRIIIIKSSPVPFCFVVVDATYKFTIVDVGAYERNSDGRILMNSKGQYLQ